MFVLKPEFKSLVKQLYWGIGAINLHLIAVEMMEKHLSEVVPGGQSLGVPGRFSELWQPLGF